MKCVWTWTPYLLNIFLLFELYSADQHTFGHLKGGDKVFYNKVIDENNTVPTNYVIIFKYLGKKIPMLSQVLIDVNANSSGNVEVTNELQNVDATISVYNALNVTATISIFAFGGRIVSALKSWPFTDEYLVKSYIIVYKKNAIVPNRPRQFYRNSIGLRQPGDELIYFEKGNIYNNNRFPSRAFEYSGDDKITCVGFSFSSPTAMVLVNTTYVSDTEFNAVAYDMNAEHFVANMSVYGFKNGLKPSTYIKLFSEDLSCGDVECQKPLTYNVTGY